MIDWKFALLVAVIAFGATAILSLAKRGRLAREREASTLGAESKRRGDGSTE